MIRSVTRNGRSIVLTAVLALILVYLFSIIGYMFFKDDFLVSVDFEEPDAVTLSVPTTTEETCAKPDELGSCNVNPAQLIAPNEGNGNGNGGGGEAKERSCDSLVMCIVTTLNQGLRNGGGIGDILRAPSSKVIYTELCQFKKFTNFAFLCDFRRVSLWRESSTICSSSSLS